MPQCNINIFFNISKYSVLSVFSSEQSERVVEKSTKKFTTRSAREHREGTAYLKKIIFEVFAGERGGVDGKLFGRACGHNGAAVDSGTRTEVDQVVCAGDKI